MESHLPHSKSRVLGRGSPQPGHSASSLRGSLLAEATFPAELPNLPQTLKAELLVTLSIPVYSLHPSLGLVSSEASAV